MLRYFEGFYYAQRGGPIRTELCFLMQKYVRYLQCQFVKQSLKEVFSIGYN